MKKKSGKSKTPRKITPADFQESPKIVNLTDVRAKRQNEERRKTERFFLKDVFQVFCVIAKDDHEELFPMDLIDASEEGFSFRVPYESSSKFPASDELRIRIYMSRDTYLSLGASVVSTMPMMDQGSRYLRYGCEIDTSFASYAAYQQLIRFIESYSRVSTRERKHAAVY